MGQTEAKSNTHDYAKFKEKYEIKKKLVDKKYGEGMLIEDKTTKSESFQNEFAPISAAQFQELFAKICNKENIKNPYIIDIIDYFMHRDTHYCSETYKIYVLFEFCNKNLESEIIDRVSDDIRRFSNEEMVYITESYITGLSFLQNNHIPHSSLSLHSLLISKSGIYKVADQTILNMPSNFEQVQSKKTDLKGVYLSPAQISAIKTNQFHQKNIYKNDVFILGICLLHAALLTPCDDIFNYEEMVYYPKILEQKFEAMKEFYSGTIINLLKTMTEEKEEDRPDFIKLNENLDKILKISQQDERKKNLFPIKTQESFNLDKNLNLNKVHKDYETSLSSALPQVKTKINSDFTTNQWTTKMKENTLLGRTSFLKKPKQVNTNSIEQITEAKEDSEIELYNHDQIDQMEINDLLKEYGIEPLKSSSHHPIPIESRNIFVSQNNFLPSAQNIQRIYESKKNEFQTNEPIFSPFKTNKYESPIEKNRKFPPQNIDSFSNQNSPFTSPKKTTQFLANPSKLATIVDYFSNGSKYEGNKENGLRNGNGRFTYVTGAFYEGEWKNNKKDGKGVLMNGDGKTIYDGFWVNDKYHGKGILYNQNINFTNEEFNYEDFDNLNGRWLRFEGVFVEDEKCGKGLLCLINGERFYGNFENDLANGNGNYYKKNGHVVNGVWKNNKLYENS